MKPRLSASKIRRNCILLLGLFLFGCSTLTPYERAIHSNSFEEIQLDHNIFKLQYKGSPNQWFRQKLYFYINVPLRRMKMDMIIFRLMSFKKKSKSREPFNQKPALVNLTPTHNYKLPSQLSLLIHLARDPL